MAQEPIKKRPLTEAEAGMAKSLEKMKKPLTSMEKMQAERAYKRLIEENKRLNPTKKVGTDMSKVPSAAKKLMELKSSPDSTKYYQDDAKLKMDVAQTQSKFGLKKASEESFKKATESMASASRQKLKGKPGYNKDGFPIKKN
jgi:hypothetical protein